MKLHIICIYLETIISKCFIDLKRNATLTFNEIKYKLNAHEDEYRSIRKVLNRCNFFSCHKRSSRRIITGSGKINMYKYVSYKLKGKSKK